VARNVHAVNGVAVEELIQTKLNADESSVSAQFGSTIAASGDIVVVTAPWADIDGKTRLELSTYSCVTRIPMNGPVSAVMPWTPPHSSKMTSRLPANYRGRSLLAHRTFQEGAVYIFDRTAPGSEIGSRLQSSPPPSDLAAISQ